MHLGQKLRAAHSTVLCFHNFRCLISDNSLDVNRDDLERDRKCKGHRKDSLETENKSGNHHLSFVMCRFHR